jgi:GAF domain-containing protein
MTWGVKPPSLAAHATIELRRIIDILQVDHASLFLRDPERARRPVHVAETGSPLADTLPEHATIVGRVLSTGRVQDLEADSDEAAGAALAMPLEHDGEVIGALLVVSRRPNRRLGAADAQVIGRATETLVERVLPVARPRPHSDRFTRGARSGPIRARR